jgi:hypothetical protein
MKKFSKIIFFLLLVLLVFMHKTILTAAGRFMAPTTTETAEILILEGTQLANKSALKTGMTLLSEGRAKRMIVVLHAPLKEGQIHLLPKNYPQFITDEFTLPGLKKEKIEVITAPIPGHPITLTEARFVVAQLVQKKVRSAILVSNGFHTRRSYGLYKQEGEQSGLHVVPYAHFTDYKCDSWWRDVQGINDFFGESVKLIYYLLFGHLSVGALWN